MLRAQLRRITLPRPSCIFGAGPPKRRYVSKLDIPLKLLPPVPVLRPTLWALTATATIFLGCATYDVYQDVKAAKRKGFFRNGSVPSYEDLENAKTYNNPLRSPFRSSSSSSSHPLSRWFPIGQLSEILSGFNGAQKVMLGFSALNIGLVGANYVAPAAFLQHFGHVPCLNRNYTLLTSMFGHSGTWHVAMNTFVLVQFATDVAESRVFKGNGSHFAAFYLSAGILSSLGSQFATMLPTRTYKYNRFVPNLGASGVISALLASWVTLDPNGKISFLFLPGSFPADSFLMAIVIIETLGLFFGTPLFNFGHGAHLSGYAIGAAYVHYDGRKRLWLPARKVAFRTMKTLKMV
ncbi:rhomboid-domain-containing protein [Daldinia eschscholtzii]|nr:rhomboid-domain-containing protein [Daldinia eschscholtzii]